MILPNRLTIYVPDRDTLPKRIALLLTEAAGGATITRAEGYWKDDEGQLIVEDMALVMCASEYPLRSTVQEAASLLFEAGEQSVAIDYGGRLFLIDPDGLTWPQLVEAMA